MLPADELLVLLYATAGVVVDRMLQAMPLEQREAILKAQGGGARLSLQVLPPYGPGMPWSTRLSLTEGRAELVIEQLANTSRLQ